MHLFCIWLLWWKNAAKYKNGHKKCLDLFMTFEPLLHFLSSSHPFDVFSVNLLQFGKKNFKNELKYSPHTNLL